MWVGVLERLGRCSMQIRYLFRACGGSIHVKVVASADGSDGNDGRRASSSKLCVQRGKLFTKYDKRMLVHCTDGHRTTP